ncbi:MAG: hypothetical protein LBT10_09175 [Methanobrevibacter sp.]|jgi:ERCC4-type nuclease|nr:hypothetical protein [Methanobrevibacter sp.]
MLQQELPLRIVGISGLCFDLVDEHSMSWHVYSGLISSLFTKGIIVVRSEDIEELIYMLVSLVIKYLNNKDGSILFNRPELSSPNPALNYLSSIIGVGAHRAELIVKEFKITTLSELLALEYDDLVEIKGIGPSSANAVLGGLHEN